MPHAGVGEGMVGIWLEHGAIGCEHFLAKSLRSQFLGDALQPRCVSRLNLIASGSFSYSDTWPVPQPLTTCRFRSREQLPM